MNKYLKYIPIFIIASALSFGIGIGVAELQIRFWPSSIKGFKTENLKTEETAKNVEEAPKNIKTELAPQEAEVENKEKAEEAPPAPAVPVEEPAAPSASKFSFAILGDTQRFDSKNPNGGFQKAVKNISAKNVDLVMAEGDLLSSCKDGCSAKLTTWKNILGSLAPKTYEMMGNHDRTGGDSADSAWQNSFKLPTNGPKGYSELVYSFDFQNSHFVVLNSEKPEEHVINKTQRDWLKNDLSKNKKENTFVFFHEPAYPVSSKIGESLDVESGERNALWNILTDNKVAAVFNGHEHIYSRKKIGNVYQFVFGNTDSFDHDLPKGGVAEYSYKGKHFGIVEVDGKQITVNLYSVEGNLIDSFKFSH